jgi:hypothetical protein
MKTVAYAAVIVAGTGLATLLGAGFSSAAPALQVGGDGRYNVSNNDSGQMWPGPYSTEGPSGPGACHWTIYAADGRITSDESTHGRADVAVSEGDVFATRNCRSWVQSYDPLETLVPAAIGSAAVGSAVGSAVLPSLATLLVLGQSGE